MYETGSPETIYRIYNQNQYHTASVRSKHGQQCQMLLSDRQTGQHNIYLFTDYTLVPHTTPLPKIQTILFMTTEIPSGGQQVCFFVENFHFTCGNPRFCQDVIRNSLNQNALVDRLIFRMWVLNLKTTVINLCIF